VLRRAHLLGLASLLGLDLAAAAAAWMHEARHPAQQAEPDRQPAATRQRGPLPVDPFVLAALVELLTPEDGGAAADDERIRAAIQAFGPSAIPAVCGMLCGEIASAKGDEGDAAIVALASERQGALRASLQAFGAELVVQHLAERAGAGAPLEVRLIAADLLGDLDHEQALRQLVALAGAFEPIELGSDSVRAALERALARHWSHGREARRRFEVVAKECARGRLPLLARASAAAGTVDSTGFLLSLLGSDLIDAELDRVVLAAAARLAARGAWTLDERDAGAVRAALSSHDLQVRRLACAVLGALADVESCEPMLALLESAEPLEREAARQGLRAICGVDLGPSSLRWAEWHRAEAAWWEAAAPAVLERLDHTDAGQVQRAIDELARHPLQRAAIAAQLAPLAVHADAAVARAACRALARSGSRAVLPWLLEALASEDDSVREASAAALRKLTGLALPADSALWSQAVGSAQSD
jgi:HEAT repeat protein